MSALLLWSALLLPQFGSDQGSAEITAAFAVDAIASGETVELHVSIDVTPGWHIYHPDQDPANGIPVSIDVSGSGVILLGGLTTAQEPEIHELNVGSFHATYLWLSGKSELVVPVTVTASPGSKEFAVTVNYQICNESVCLPEMSKEFTLALYVGEGEAVPSPDSEPDPEQADVEEEGGSVSQDLWNGQSFDLEKEDGDPSKVNVQLEVNGTVGEGETVEIVVQVEVEEGWHVYDPAQDPDLGVPVTAVVHGEGVTVVEKLTTTMEPESHITRYGGGVQQYWWQSGTLEFRGKLRFDGPVPSDAKVRILWQACTEETCLPVAQATFPLSSGAALSASGLPSGFWAFLLAAVSAGLLTLLTPCVFPMIPVTISYFTKRAETGKGTPIGNATAYAAGIIFTFVGIGVGAALLLGPNGAGEIGSNPWINIAIGLLFLVMAISLFGFFEIQAPRFLQNFASKTQVQGQTKGGYLPVAMMAVAFSITAFTCTVAFVGAVLVAGLQLGWIYLVGGMFVYGLVFALPFFFLALLPSRLAKMPTAGGWMNTVKVCAGFVELLAAIKFFSNTDQVWELEILTWPVVFASASIILLLWGAYMFGLYKLPHDYEKPRPGKRRLGFAVVITAAGLWMIPGIFDRDYSIGRLGDYMPPKYYGQHIVDEATGQELGPAGIPWYEDYDEAFLAAKDSAGPLFMDFTGATCTNCRSMENLIFPADDVLPLLKEFTRVALWTDKHPEYSKMQSDRFKTVALPLYVLIDPRTDTVLGTSVGFQPDSAKFAEFLQKGLDAYAAN